MLLMMRNVSISLTLPMSSIDLGSLKNYAALLIPGGHGPMFDLATDPITKQIVSTMYELKTPVVAICHGVAALLNYFEISRWE